MARRALERNVHGLIGRIELDGTFSWHGRRTSVAQEKGHGTSAVAAEAEFDLSDTTALLKGVTGTAFVVVVVGAAAVARTGSCLGP